MTKDREHLFLLWIAALVNAFVALRPWPPEVTMHSLMLSYANIACAMWMTHSIGKINARQDARGAFTCK